MLLAVEGGGLFSASASGYSKGLTLLFSGDKDGDRPMRVVPWNHYQVVDQEADPVLQLDSIKNRVSRGCAASFSCFGGASAGLETPSPLKVEPVQQHREISSPESAVVVVSEKGKDQITEADNGSSKEAFKLSLRSSLKRPSVAESRSLEDIKEYETLTVDGSDLTGDMARRKVQWPDACGSELTQVREFEPSEMGLSDEEWEINIRDQNERGPEREIYRLFFKPNPEPPSDVFPVKIEMRRINSLYGRIGMLRRVPEESTKKSHTLLASLSFSTEGSYGGDGELQQNSSKVKIFDRDLKRIHRDRAAWLSRQKNDSFVDAVAENLLDRLEDCKKSFPTAFCLGGSLGAVKRLLRGRGGIEKLIMMDTSYDMIKSCRDAQEDSLDNSIETSYFVGDEEFLPVKESSVDLIISSLGLHWTNDLPGSMIQCKLALKPDGLFLAAILGGETLKELRIACTLAHMEREGGISPRLSPLAQVRDAGNLLTRAGFSLPGVDVDEYVVKYKSAMDLIEHLRAMGETNALLERNKILNRETALATAAIYDSMFATEDGTIPATFQVIYMTGWREHSSHPQAKRRGSATVSFTDLQKQFGGQS